RSTGQIRSPQHQGDHERLDFPQFGRHWGKSSTTLPPPCPPRARRVRRPECATTLRGKPQPAGFDVENPAPGTRPGQLHLQDVAGNKYLYDFEAGSFKGLPRSIADKIADDPVAKRAIVTGKRYLGLDGDS